MGHPFANVFWALLGGGTTAGQAGFDSWTQKFANAYFAQFGSSLSTQTNLSHATGVLFRSTTDVLHSFTLLSGVGLVSAAFVQDASASVVISWGSNAYWRGGKPRTYLPGIELSYTDGKSQITAAGDTWYTQKANDFLAAVNALSDVGITQTGLGFVHFFVAGVLQTPGIFYPITGAAIHPRFGTQRRRLGAWIP
jgi:hypothetical protein